MNVYHLVDILGLRSCFSVDAFNILFGDSATPTKFTEGPGIM